MRRVQAELLAAADRDGCALPWREAAVAPHVTLGRDYAADRPAERIDGISWQVDALELVLSHPGATLHEVLDRWMLPERKRLAA